MIVFVVLGYVMVIEVFGDDGVGYVEMEKFGVL